MKCWCERAEVSVCFCRVTKILWEWRKGPMGWCEGRDQQPGPNVTEDETGKGNADSGRRACFSWSFTYFNICEEILTMQKKPELITSSQTIHSSILDPLLYSGLPTTPTLLLKPPAGYVSQQRVSRESATSCTHKVAVGTLTPQQQQRWPRPASCSLSQLSSTTDEDLRLTTVTAWRGRFLGSMLYIICLRDGDDRKWGESESGMTRSNTTQTEGVQVHQVTPW